MAGSTLEGILESAKQAATKLAANIPFLKKRLPKAPEPFSTIEDSTPHSEILVEANAAPAFLKQGKTNIDIKETAATLAKNKTLLAILAAVLLFLLALAITSLIISMPPPEYESTGRITPEGRDLVSRWMIPATVGIDARMEFEREVGTKWTLDEAWHAGIDPAAVDIRRLAAKNDARAQAILGSVP